MGALRRPMRLKMAQKHMGMDGPRMALGLAVCCFLLWSAYLLGWLSRGPALPEELRALRSVRSDWQVGTLP